MTAPSLRSLGTVWVGVTNAPSFAEPAGAVSTDIIEIKFFLDGTNTVSAAPTGFASATDAPQVNTNHSLQVYWARRSAAGAGPYGFTLSASSHVEGRAAAIQGCITSGNPYEAADGNVNTGLVSTAPAVSATSTGPDRYASYAATNWTGGAWTPPSGFTEQWDANNRIATYDDAALPTATTVTPQAVCAGTDRMSAWVGILLPVPSGSTVNADASLTATATAATTAAITRPAAAAVTATGALSGTAAVTRPATTSLTAAATITATPALTASGQAAVAAVAAITANAAVVPPGGNITPRPNAGTTARPNGGTTARPFTGITIRP